jgi:hypothetical protein
MSALLATLVNVVSVMINIAVLFVLVKTFQAADRQAKAATELTVATHQQIALQKEQAEAARIQQKLARRQIEESLRPIVLFPTGTGDETHMQTWVANHGAGPALDIRWSFGTLHTAKEWRTLGSGILAKEEAQEWVYSAKDGMARGGIVFHYKSLVGDSYATQFNWVGGKLKASYIDAGA